MTSIDDLSDEQLLDEQLNLIRDFNYEDNLSLLSKILKADESSKIDLSIFRKEFEAYIDKANSIYEFNKYNSFDFAMDALPTNLWVKTLRVFGYTSRKLSKKEAIKPEFMNILDKKMKGVYYN